MSSAPEPALAVAAALLAIALLALLLRRDVRVAILLAGSAVLLALTTLSRISDDPAAGRAWASVAAVLLAAGLLTPRDARRDEGREDAP